MTALDDDVNGPDADRTESARHQTTRPEAAPHGSAHRESGKPPVSVLGLGPMGYALAAAFLSAGHPVTVWNRTPGRARDLPGRGAAETVSAEAAIRAGQVVVACLVDYPAVRASVGDRSAHWTGRFLVNLSSGAPAEARAMAGWAAENGVPYLDGAILTPTPAIGTPAARILYSGDAAVHEATSSTLAALGGTGTYLGGDPGRACAYDVALLDLFVTAVHGLVHAFALAAAEDIAPGDLAPYAAGMGALLPEMAARFAAQLRAGVFPGDRSTLASAASALAHILAEAESHGLDTGILAAAKSVTDRAVAQGHGAEGLARLATLLSG